MNYRNISLHLPHLPQHFGIRDAWMSYDIIKRKLTNKIVSWGKAKGFMGWLPVTHRGIAISALLQWVVEGKLYKIESMPSLKSMSEQWHAHNVASHRLFVIPPSTDHSKHPQIPLVNREKTTRETDFSAFLCLVKSFYTVLWVLHSITKTLEAAYLLKTGGWERVKKVSQSSIFFLVHRVALLKPPELWFLPLDSPSTIPASLIHLGPRYLHWFWLARHPNFCRRTQEKSIIFTALQKTLY